MFGLYFPVVHFLQPGRPWTKSQGVLLFCWLRFEFCWLAWRCLHVHLQDYIAEREPVTYSCMSYTTIELSSSLAKLQQEYVVEQRGHSQAWRCVQGDAAQPQSWADVAAALPGQHSMQQHVFVLMLEVLDNLPHDRCGLRGTAQMEQTGVKLGLQTALEGVLSSLSAADGKWRVVLCLFWSFNDVERSGVPHT